jgi:hypothetical protein
MMPLKCVSRCRSDGSVELADVPEEGCFIDQVFIDLTGTQDLLTGQVI